MSKKFTPAGIALDVAGDVIEGGLAGAGAAIGGAASGIGALAGGLASGAGSALGGALQGALTEPDVYITSYGAIGSYAKSTVKTTVNIQLPNGPERVEATEDMPLDKLMVIAIKYLSSISKNLRAQSIAENRNNEQERLANRESLIEKADSPTPVTSDGKPRSKNKMSGMTKALLGIGALGLGAAALSKIDMSELDDLGRNIAAFQDKYSWVIDLLHLGSMAKLGQWVLKIPGLKELIKSGGSALARTAGSALAGMGATGAISMAGAIATTLAGIVAVDAFVKDSAGTALAPMQKMEQKYGIKLNYDTSSGTVPVFKGATINGQDYAPGKLPKEYQEIYNSYSGVRGSNSVSDIDKKYSDLKNTSDPTAESKPTVSSTDMKDSKYNPDSGSYNAQFALSFFKARGWTHEQASGIVGNLLVESPGLKIDAEGDGGEAYGIAQWHPDRQAKFKQVIKKDIRSSTLEDQLNFVDWELKNSESKAGGLLKGANSASMAAAIVDEHYERSAGLHTGKRMATAAAISGGNFNTPDPSSYSEGGPMSEVKEMVVDGYKDLLKFISLAGKTGTQFRPITSKAGNWDKSAKLLNDQAKMETDMAMGRKETKIKNQGKPNSMSQLRKANGGSLDVINPNYKIGSASILNTYILSFSPDKKAWA